jgi:pSer/pThr/pTyr-binding forkhead associated (FHA) protein
MGRDPCSDVALSWDGISRAHAWLEKSEHGVWAVVCNGSGNGTFLNGGGGRPAPPPPPPPPPPLPPAGACVPTRRAAGQVARAQLAEGDVLAFGHGHDVPHGEPLEAPARTPRAA